MYKSLNKFSQANRHVRGGSAARKAAFTLAEVLITLGVIGVVAALTLPELIQNYQKQVTVAQLKSSYNILSNVLKRAEADHGSIAEWGLEANGRVDETTVNAADLNDNFVRQYILPYTSDARFYNTSSLADIGYKKPIKSANGSIKYSLDSVNPTIQFKNGMIVIVSAARGALPSDQNKVYVLGINFLIDIDGPSGQNRSGRDVFFALVPYSPNARLMFFRDYAINSDKTVVLYDTPRNELLDKCKTSGSYCGYLIQQDAWQIKDDYPW